MNLGYIDVYQKREFWKELSERISGEFKIKHYSSMSLASIHLYFKCKGVEVEFYESDTQPLKLKFSHLARLKFALNISSEDLIEKVIKLFGGNKEFQVGNPMFDDIFLIQGDDDLLIKKFLTKEIQDLMHKVKVYSLSFNPNRKTEKIDFTTTINRQINDSNSLFEVYQLICLIVIRLKELSVL